MQLFFEVRVSLLIVRDECLGAILARHGGAFDARRAKNLLVPVRRMPHQGWRREPDALQLVDEHMEIGVSRIQREKLLDFGRRAPQRVVLGDPRKETIHDAGAEALAIAGVAPGPVQSLGRVRRLEKSSAGVADHRPEWDGNDDLFPARVGHDAIPRRRRKDRRRAPRRRRDQREAGERREPEHFFDERGSVHDANAGSAEESEAKSPGVSARSLVAGAAEVDGVTT